MIYQVILLIISIVILYYGAEFTLESAEKIGLYFGLSPLVIGLLIVGFGTSLPEFFVSQSSVLRGSAPMALGNIIGSNLANLFLIMGISGLLTTLFLSSIEIKIQLIFHFFLSALALFVLTQNKLTWLSTFLLALFFVTYLIYTFRDMHKQRKSRALDIEDIEAEIDFKTFLFLILGFVFLYTGGEVLVYSGSNISRLLGISEYVISAIFVAFGTSFPELVTAVLACVKKKNTDLITGNIIGSNIFNISFVLCSLGPYQIDIAGDYLKELITLVFLSLFLLLHAYLKRPFSKVSGLLFLSGYCGMIYYWL